MTIFAIIVISYYVCVCRIVRLRVVLADERSSSIRSRYTTNESSPIKGTRSFQKESRSFPSVSVRVHNILLVNDDTSGALVAQIIYRKRFQYWVPAKNAPRRDLGGRVGKRIPEVNASEIRRKHRTSLVR
jgi:hypothetical protein